MKLEIADNVTRNMASVLTSAVGRGSDIRIAVAFASRAGLAIIEESLQEAIRRGASLEFLVGLDFRTTEPEALSTLFELSQNHAGVDLYCMASLEPQAVYHPKLYLARGENDVVCVVGSSNLTAGGLKRNVEVNVAMEGAANDEPISDLYTTYNRLKFHPRRVVPDAEYILLYQELRVREAKRSNAPRDIDSRRLRTRFDEKAAVLRRPVPMRRDLVGWLDLVYDCLPDRDFSNNDVYAREAEFRKRYPSNLNVRAKIRQQLQVLRDMGFIEHLGPARWRKL
jgi:HKD family nuclease